MTGFSDVIGSWKIIEMRRPRRSRNSSGWSSSRSTPSKSTLPPATWPAGLGRRPMIAREVTLLPQPDSPTTPTVSWAWTSKVTPRTAWTRPDEDENSTSRSRTERRGASLAVRPATDRPSPRSSSLEPRVEGLAQAVAQQVEAEDRDDDRDTGNSAVNAAPFER